MFKVSKEGQGRNSLACFGTVAAVSLALLALSGCGKKADKKEAGPAPVVLVAPVLQKTVPLYGEYVARTEARQSVDIKARVGGYLEKIFFKEGRKVKAGQILFLIDQRPYKAALQDAQGQLAQAEAALWKAQKDVDRYRPLVAQDAAPQQDLDKAEAEAKVSTAAIVKAKAGIDKAELDLQFTRIHAPITGIIGKEEVTKGNLVTKDKTLLTTMSSWNPMRVVFSLSETDYLLLSRRYPEESREGSIDKPEEVFELLMADNSIYPFKGSLSFVDRALDPTTGTLNIYVSFPNPNRLLRPGLFGRVRVPLKDEPNALLVPQRAVQEMQGVQTLLVVGPENKVALRTVTLGPRFKDYFIITKGVKAGELIVVEGLQKAIPGQKVTPKEEPISQDQPASQEKPNTKEKPTSKEKPVGQEQPDTQEKKGE